MLRFLYAVFSSVLIGLSTVLTATSIFTRHWWNNETTHSGLWETCFAKDDVCFLSEDLYKSLNGNQSHFIKEKSLHILQACSLGGLASSFTSYIAMSMIVYWLKKDRQAQFALWFKLFIITANVLASLLEVLAVVFAKILLEENVNMNQSWHVMLCACALTLLSLTCMFLTLCYARSKDKKSVHANRYQHYYAESQKYEDVLDELKEHDSSVYKTLDLNSFGGEEYTKLKVRQAVNSTKPFKKQRRKDHIYEEMLM